MKRVILLIVVVLAVSLTGCSTKAEETKTACFDFTVTELLDYFESECGIYAESPRVIDMEDGSKLVSFTFMTINDTADTKMHYSITYDGETDCVYSISFFFGKDFMEDLTSAITRYYYHIYAISEKIESGIDTDTISDTIQETMRLTDWKEGFAIYESDTFCLFASCSEDYFDAYFTPLEN